MKRLIFFVLIFCVLSGVHAHAACSPTTGQFTSTTCVSVETSHNGGWASWPLTATGTQIVWQARGSPCTAAGVHCFIDVHGSWNCDGPNTALNNCTLANARPQNISMVSVKSLFTNNPLTYTHTELWYRTSGTSSMPGGQPYLGVDSTDSVYVDKLLHEYKNHGLDGWIADWYGKPYGTGGQDCGKKFCNHDLATKAMVARTGFYGLKYYILVDNGAWQDCLNVVGTTTAYTTQVTYCGGDCELIQDGNDTLADGHPTGADKCTINDRIVSDLQYVEATYIAPNGVPDPNYSRDTRFGTNRPLVTFFSASSGTANWAAIEAKLTTNPKLLFPSRPDSSNGYTVSTSSGAWSWKGRPPSNSYPYPGAPNAFTVAYANDYAGEHTACGTPETTGTNTNPYNYGTLGEAQADCFMDKTILNPTKNMNAGVVSKHDNRSASWTQSNGGAASTYILPPQCGRVMLHSAASLNAKMAGQPASMYEGITFNTYNDWFEASGLGFGMESCWHITATGSSANGGSLTWTITAFDPDIEWAPKPGAPTTPRNWATTNNIDHFEIYVSGTAVGDLTQQNLYLLDANPVSVTANPVDCSPQHPFPCTQTYTINNLKSKYGLNAGTDYFFVKLVGKPYIINELSGQTQAECTSGAPPCGAPIVLTSSGVTAVLDVTPSPTCGSPCDITASSVRSTSTGAAIASSVFHWGDGTADTTISGTGRVSHTYATPGAYTLTLTVNNGSSDTASVTINSTSAQSTTNPIVEY